MKIMPFLFVMMLVLTLVFGCGDNKKDPTPAPDDGTEWEVFKFGFDRLNVRCITIDQQGRKWIGTEGQGVIVFDDQRNTWTQYLEPGGFIHDIHIANDGVVWVGTEFSGLRRFDGTTWTYVSGLPDWEIPVVTTDHDGNVWAGTWRGGLAKFDGQAWAVYDTTNSQIPSNRILSLLVDPVNTLWIGTRPVSIDDYGHVAGGGLTTFDGSSWLVYNTDNSGLPHNSVSCLTMDHANRKWMGTPEGVAIFDGQNWTVYDNTQFGLYSDGVVAISIDDSNNKWIAVHVGGFVKFDDITWTSYDPIDYNTGSGLVEALCFENQTGKLWIGSYGSGLATFKESDK